MIENKHRTPDFINQPETLTVTRDGFMDDEYYDAIYAAKRRAALREAGHVALGAVAHSVVNVGKGIVFAFTHELKTSEAVIDTAETLTV